MTIAAVNRATAARSSLVPWPWLVALAGFLVMYVPVYWSASKGIWQTEEFGHAPLILAVATWLFWQRRAQLPVASALVVGNGCVAIFVAAAVIYVTGRALSMASAEFVSHWLMIGCVVMLVSGSHALKSVWFAWVYLLFMVPLPATLVDALTGPLKSAISTLVVDGLHAVGYPIARAGVMITIGPYQLLVADACSGLNSMFSLAALGTLFIHLVSAQRPRLQMVVLVLAIVPIAFAANVVRVITLVLVTYHAGDEAGQGYLHGAAGIVLMLVALLAFMVLDRALTLCWPSQTKRRSLHREAL